MKTIIAAFTDSAAAQQGAELLRNRLMAQRQDKESRVDLLGYGTATTDNLTSLRQRRIPDERAELYAEAIRRGAVVLIADAPDDQAEELADELDRLGSLDLETAAKRWRSEGWTGYDNRATQFNPEATASERTALENESLGHITDTSAAGDLDVVEEHVAVGKREVPRGGIRVRTYVVERPVEENVELREERIDVQRERVDEPISPGAADSTFTEEEFVVTAKGEEAVVGKEARVVERVHVGKSEDVRTETVHETERRREVEVEPIEEGDEHRPPPRR